MNNTLTIEDEIYTLDLDRIAVDDDLNIYDVYNSSKSYSDGMCIGRLGKIANKDKKCVASLMPMATTPYPNSYKIYYRKDLEKSYNIFLKLQIKDQND